MMFGDILAYSATAVRSSLGVVVEPGHFLSLGPLLVALAIALVALRLRSQQRGRHSAWRHLLAMLFPRRIFLHCSARLDYAIFLINEGLLFFLTLGAIVTPAVLANVLLDVVGYRTDASGSSGVILAERAICTLYLVLLWDFGATFAHYLKHRVPLLWEFHKVHHSAEVLTPVTALRRHPVDSLVGAVMTTFTMGTGMAIWVLVLQRPPDAIGIFGTVAGIYLWRLLGYNLRHSHVWISYGDFWNSILISPAQHQVHHSVDPRHYDKNFGHIFACWDRLFGTLYLPAHNERVVFGIEAAEMPHYRNLYGVYVMPFVKAANLVLRRPQPAPVEIADRTSAD